MALPDDYYTSRYSGEEIDEKLNHICNPNLLDNWYFPNPVNQRGQTEYTPGWNQYTIDRWSMEGNTGDIKVVVSTGCVDVKNMLQQSAAYSINFKQVLPTEICLPGKTYTLSVLTKNVVGSVICYLAQSGAPYHASFEFPITSGLSTYTGVMIEGQQRVGFTLSAGASISLIAIKLELGPSQTLAHQENGVWVPNEIKDYGEQLRRCQRYFQTFATQTLRPTDALDFRPTMRVNPVLSTLTIGGKTIYTASADL